MRYEQVKPSEISDLAPVLHSLVLMAEHVEDHAEDLEDDDEISEYSIALECFHKMTTLAFDASELREVLGKIGVTVHSLGPIVTVSDGFFESVILRYVNKNEFMEKIQPYRHGGKKLVQIFESRGFEF